jgi:hypothetical protein
MRIQPLRPLLTFLTRPFRMPRQTTLSFDSPNRQLSISPQKPKPSHLTISTKGYQPDLRKLHHDEEDMAAASKSRAKAQAEGKKVPMHDENELGDEAFARKAGDGEGGKGKSETTKAGGEGERAKGAPSNKKRSRSPEGGGVAGRDGKKSKNAYEISMSIRLDYLIYMKQGADKKGGRSLLQKMQLGSMPIHL